MQCIQIVTDLIFALNHAQTLYIFNKKYSIISKMTIKDF